MDNQTPQLQNQNPLLPQSYGWARMIGLSLAILSVGLAIAFGGFYLGQKKQTKATTTPSATSSPK